jgi:hypothetical protein
VNSKPASFSHLNHIIMANEQKGGDLHTIYMDFCKFGDKNNHGEMDNAHFAKFCKDTGLVDKNCTATDVDIIFTKVKAKSERKINFEKFDQALHQIAAKRFPKDSPADGYTQVVDLIKHSKGPDAHGTKAAHVKLHDDKSLYTGVHSQGGPSTVDNVVTLDNLLDRTPADIRGRKPDQIEK